MSILSPTKSTKKHVDFINKTVDKKELNRLLARIYADYGLAKTGALANNLKDLGFKYATMAGVTVSIADLEVPEQKKQLLADAEADIEHSTQRFMKGEITEVERYTKVIDTWSATTETLTQMIVDNFNRLNPVYMMAFSGARGNLSQVRQLVGMRGLMADAQGQIIDFPIRSNFREGLSVTEYIISSYGARKGLVDTALKTADSGYLTRRLVDVAQDVIIQEADCGTQQGVLMDAITEGESIMAPLVDRIISRTAAVDVVSPETGEVLVQAGQIITPAQSEAIDNAGIKEVLVRSGLTCASQVGVCQKCYGWSLTNNKLVDLGEAIGIMAAQSIGEPGTQLTMRTFHTGGVFSGGFNREEFKARHDGTVQTKLPTKEFRTRHGDVVQITTKDVSIEVETTEGKIDKYNLPYHTIVNVNQGDKVKKGNIIAVFEPITGRRTEKATKDITSDMSGEVFFEGFEADEKRDRQGNISRTANRAGTIWVLGGDVYNLPAGSKHLVKDGQQLKKGEIIAETMVISEHGGEVRIPEELKTETAKVGGETVERVVEGRDLTIIIASVTPDNAELQQTKKEQIWHVKGSKESYVLKSPEGTMVENGSIIAELLDDRVSVPTSGEIRFEDVEVDEQRILTASGKVLFLPEEIHQISKDSSLKVPGIESGMHVEAGTEIVKGVTCQTSGIVEITEENDIIREVVVRPGELHRVDDISTINVDDGTIVDKGTEVAPGIKAKERCMVTINFKIEEPGEDEDEDLDDTADLEYAEVLLRPFEEFVIEPPKVDINFESTDSENISIVPVTQLQYKDGDKIRQIEGASLLRTSLVLQMRGYLERMKGVTELVEGKKGATNLKISVLENLPIRREAAVSTGETTTASQTHLLVKNGQVIDKKAPVVKTQVITQTEGRVSLGNAADKKDVRRVLIVTDAHEQALTLSGSANVKVGQFIKAGHELDNKNTPAPQSGQITKVDGKTVVLREGRPYLISPGTQLQVENRSLTQRGDLIASLIFEREKTGDIVQGLPRVEELLEGRKPKENAVVSPYDATVEIVWEEDAQKLFLNSENGRTEVQFPVGANIIVEDKQAVKAGQALTDGPINPHDILAINGVEAVRKYLVDEVQRVYRSQGVEIADKHVEIIVRQMTKKVRIDDGGDTTLLSGELVDEKIVQEANRMVEERGKQPATYHPILLGITKASLNTDSFISAASFQETTRVLAEAAVEGKKDFLNGLKENVIIGRLIPAGTGFPHFKDERADMLDEQEGAYAAKTSMRKPSAILEEIESMFGSPEITEETLGDMLLEDGSLEESGLYLEGGDTEEYTDSEE